MTIKVTREYEFEIDDIGSYLLHYGFLENDGFVVLNEDIYFSDLNRFEQIEVLKAMKEQFNNAVDNEIENIKEEKCNG